MADRPTNQSATSAALDAAETTHTADWRAITLRLPPDLLAQVDALVAETGASRNALLIEALTHAVTHPTGWLRRVTDLRRTRWTRYDRQGNPVDR